MTAPRSLVLGTAGHIDHGKTALVRALTGVDTDRLKEEKERGITIDLGFAEWADQEVRLGIVDVPGHEGFVRNMLAGATGMDVVLLVVAADEGVMPQTREHLAIVTLLGVERLVVALTKVDRAEADWLELVRDEVRELLEAAGHADAPVVATSAVTGEGLEELGRTLVEVARTGDADDPEDVARLPVDRVFTVRGTGTVVTGTLWSGTLRDGQAITVLPGPVEARIRGLQVHGREVEEARAGERTAVALSGADVDRASLDRGQVVVDRPTWPVTSMITARVALLPATAWSLAHNQRVRVHLGTAEILARVVLLEEGREALGPGEEGWVQLRLESPAVARTGERFVLRSYSPVTTVAGGRVAEADAPKRTRLDPATRRRLETLLGGSPDARVAAAAALAGWTGVPRDRLPVVAGCRLAEIPDAEARVAEAGGLVLPDAVVAPEVVEAAASAVEAEVDRHHEAEPLRPGVPVERLRNVLPGHRHPELADAVVGALAARRAVAVEEGVVARPGFTPRVSEGQARLRDRLRALYLEAGLEAPGVPELPPGLRDEADLWPLLRLLEADGELVLLEEEIFVDADVLRDAVHRVVDGLGGRTGLGPTDFRELLPVSRKHLLPILRWMDRVGVTVRAREGREVVEAVPPATFS